MLKGVQDTKVVLTLCVKEVIYSELKKAQILFVGPFLICDWMISYKQFLAPF